MADSIAHSITDYPVGIVYLLGDWATDCQATRIAGQLDNHRLISSMFDISPSPRRPATTAARRRVDMIVNRLVGMGL